MASGRWAETSIRRRAGDSDFAPGGAKYLQGNMDGIHGSPADYAQGAYPRAPAVDYAQAPVAPPVAYTPAPGPLNRVAPVVYAQETRQSPVENTPLHAWRSPPRVAYDSPDKVFYRGEDPEADAIVDLREQQKQFSGLQHDAPGWVRQKAVDELPSNRELDRRLSSPGQPSAGTLRRRRSMQQETPEEAEQFDDLMDAYLEGGVDANIAGHTVSELLAQYKQYCPKTPHLNAVKDACVQWPPEIRDDNPGGPILGVTFMDISRSDRGDFALADSKRIGKSRLQQSMKRKQKAMEKELKQALKRQRKRLARKDSKPHVMSSTYESWLLFWAAMRSRWKSFVEHIAHIELWNSTMRSIEGRYGSGVASFYEFVRWLFVLNAVLCIFWSGLLVVPQALEGVNRTETFSASDIVTGDNYLAESLLFMGSYSGPNNVDDEYNIPLAYFLVPIGSFVLVLLAIARRMAQRYGRKTHHEDAGVLFPFSELAFASWDHMLTQQRSAHFKNKAIRAAMLELLAEAEQRAVVRTTTEQNKLLAKRIAVNVVVAAMLGGSLYALNVLANAYLDSTDAFEQLYIPGAVALFNAMLPLCFIALATLESYRPATEIKLLKARSYIMRMASIYIVIIKVYRVDGIDCWETVAGQELYKLFLINAGVTYINTFGADIGRSLMWDFAPECLKPVRAMLGPPQFQTAKSTMEVLFMQALIWIGTFFAPLLFVVGLIGMMGLFFAKYGSMMLVVLPPFNRYRLKNDNFDMLLLLLTLFLSVGPVAYALVRLDPSTTCGPFRGETQAWNVLSRELETFPAWLTDLVKFFGTPGFVLPLFLVVALYIYYNYATERVINQTTRELRLSLLKQIEDKRYLIRTHNIS
eukprot:m.69256 g.69256  ORF g.69256 m.69256 type:complete len:864 (-) comp13970_c0_seq2:117-2708(-)